MQRQDKRARLQVIRMIVGNQAIESQEALMQEMDKAGFTCTQTTLSRDLKQLRISKVRARNGQPVYALPSENHYVPAPSREEINQSKWGVVFSANLMVVHTPPGHASMVAYDIDSAHQPLFLGTVAGDDTVLVVLSEEAEHVKVLQAIREIIPQLQGKV